MFSPRLATDGRMVALISQRFCRPMATTSTSAQIKTKQPARLASLPANSMRAWAVQAFNLPLVQTEMAVPELQRDDQVLLRVMAARDCSSEVVQVGGRVQGVDAGDQAASTNPIDILLCQGHGRQMLSLGISDSQTGLPEPRRRKMRPLRLLLIICGTCFVCFLLGKPMRVDGPSMKPTINSGEWVWMSKLRRKKPQVGDIFFFNPPSNPSRIYVKRIAALGGQQVRNKRGNQIMVPFNTVWVLSDNPNPGMIDSHKFGPVNVRLLKGRATAIIWPPKRWSRLGKKKI